MSQVCSSKMEKDAAMWKSVCKRRTLGFVRDIYDKVTTDKDGIADEV